MYNNFEDLVNSLVLPSASRPILGSNRDNSSNYWQKNPIYYQRNNFWLNSNSDTDESPSTLTPVGSPLKYSPHIWPKSVHNNKRQISGKSFIDEDSNDSKYEFETNGIDVPITTKDFKSIPKITVPQPTTAPNYNLFKGFAFAKLRPIGDKDSFRPKSRRRPKTQTFCSFCKNNNETPDVYNSHVVKDPFGRTMCPVLRDYDCPKCRSGGGDNGHTIRYCPLNKPGVVDFVPSVIKQLKNSRSADGKKRFPTNGF